MTASGAIALEPAEARRDAERLGLLEDRDRIAKDPYDVVIQRLFATAMTLMGSVRLVERPEAVKRGRHAIDEPDETIRHQERAGRLGGTATIETPEGRGTRLRRQVPL